MMRQIAGAFAEYEKERLVAKLRHARERKRAAGVKVEGRKSLSETNPEAVALAKRLARGNRKDRLSLREVGARLALEGHTATSGRPYSSSVVARMRDQARGIRSR